MKTMDEINRKGQVNAIFPFCKTYNNIWMKCVSFTLFNWINKLQEIVEGNEKTSTRFKRVNYNKILFI